MGRNVAPFGDPPPSALGVLRRQDGMPRWSREVAVLGRTVWLQASECEPDLSMLHTRTGTVFVSMKNRVFSIEMLRFLGQFVGHFCHAGIFCVVDVPYKHNVQAEDLPMEAATAKLTSLRRISREVTRRLERVVSSTVRGKDCVLPWGAVANRVPQWVRDEIHHAFQLKGDFYETIIRQTQAALGHVISPVEAPRYTGFVIEELPVLVSWYYLLNLQIVDIYPGEQAEVFWLLEENAFVDELPRLSEAIATSCKPIYARVT